MEYSLQLKEKQRVNIAKAMDNSKYENVTFVVGQEQMEFRANRTLLALISSVFEAMLFGPMEEGKTDAVISIEDIDAIGFQCVLNFAYAKDPAITLENVVSVKNVCRKYDISGLSAACDTYLERSINAQNICILLDQSVDYKLDEYVKMCMDRMEHIVNTVNTVDIVNSEGFMALNVESMRLLLQCDNLRINEEDLWDAVMKWAETRSNGLSDDNHDIDQEPSSKRRRLNSNHNSHNVDQSEILRSVAPYIRFGLMGSTYFSERVKSTGCLSKDEVIAVFEYMAMRKKNPNFRCDKFSTKPRETVISPLLKFEVFSPLHFGVSNGGLDINGATRGDDCQGFLVYPESSKPDGYLKDVHFWSLMLLGKYCYHDVAVVSRRKSVEQVKLPAKSLCGGHKAYTASVFDGIRKGWKVGQILTVVLDCDRGDVNYYIDEKLQVKQQDKIKKGKPYWFAMILCPRAATPTAANHCRVVRIPEIIANLYN